MISNNQLKIALADEYNRLGYPNAAQNVHKFFHELPNPERTLDYLRRL